MDAAQEPGSRATHDTRSARDRLVDAHERSGLRRRVDLRDQLQRPVVPGTEALRQLTAAEAKSPLTAFDRKTIADFKGFAYVRLNNLRAAQDAYESALATGAYPPEEAQKTNQMVFRLAAGNQDYATAVAYGEQLAATGSATALDLAVMSQIYYLRKDCKSSADWADKAITRRQMNRLCLKLGVAWRSIDGSAMPIVIHYCSDDVAEFVGLSRNFAR